MYLLVAGDIFTGGSRRESFGLMSTFTLLSHVCACARMCSICICAWEDLLPRLLSNGFFNLERCFWI